MSDKWLNMLLWIPFGAVTTCWVCKRKITQRVAHRLDEASAANPSPSEWKSAKAHIANYRLGLYLAAAAGGAVVGIAIGSLGFLLL
jgi:hypothetical protein